MVNYLFLFIVIAKKIMKININLNFVLSSLILVMTELLLNFDETYTWVLGHHEISVNKTAEDNSGVQEECSMEAKPGQEIGK